MIIQRCRGSSDYTNLHVQKHVHFWGSLPLQNTTLRLWFPSASDCLSGRDKAVQNCTHGCTHTVWDHVSADGCLLRVRATKTPRDTHVCLHKQSKTQVSYNTLSAVERNSHRGKSGSLIDPAGLHDLNKWAHLSIKPTTQLPAPPSSLPLFTKLP